MKPTPRLKDPVYPVPALEKGLDLLEILSAKPAGFALVELAAATGRKVTEIFRMVACLKRRGYIVVDPQTERLTLGMKLFELAHRHPPTERLIAVALSQMQTLAQQTGQSCHLAVHSNGEMLVIAQVDSTRHMGFAVHVGAKIGLATSASGRVFLAFQEAREQSRLLNLAQSNLSSSTETIATKSQASGEAAFEATGQQIRRKGYVSMPSDFIRGITNMSFPILSRCGDCVAAITIPYLQWAGDHGYPDLAATRTRLGEIAQTISSSVGNIERAS